MTTNLDLSLLSLPPSFFESPEKWVDYACSVFDVKPSDKAQRLEIAVYYLANHPTYLSSRSLLSKRRREEMEKEQPGKLKALVAWFYQYMSTRKHDDEDGF